MNLLEQGYVQEILYPEFYECNKNFEEDLLRVLTTPKTRRVRYTPRGYHDWTDKYEPYPELLCKLIKLMYEFKYSGRRSIRECVAVANQDIDELGDVPYTIETQGGLSNIFLRIQRELNLTDHEQSIHRIKQLRTERMLKAKEEGRKGLHNYSVEEQEKIRKRRKLASYQKELKDLKRKEKTLKVSAAKAARQLELNDDPSKVIICTPLSADILFFLCFPTMPAVKSKISGAPSIIISENLIQQYNMMLAGDYSEAECMRVYKEIILGDHRYDERQIAFLPTPRQYKFLSAPEDIVLYGGAAGGGKSYSLVLDPLRYVDCRDHNAVIIRRSMPELRQLISISQELYSMLRPKPQWKESQTTWHFPSGAKIWFSYLETAADKLKYQGQDYTYVGFDELSQHATDEGFSYLRSRLRRPLRSKHIQPYIRATANPGAQWVYDMFIAPAEPGKMFYYPGSENSDSPKTMKFIPAKLEDNPHLDHDGEYRSLLETLSETDKRQLLYGDWHASDDAMFPDFSTSVHVVEPHYIPKHWNRVAGLDYGYRDPSAAVWYAVNPDDGSIIIYDEFVERGLTGKEFAIAVRAREQEELVLVDHPIDWSVFARTGHTGPTIAESMLSVPGFRVRPADKNRIAGWQQIHEYLRSDPRTGLPKLTIFKSCVNTIRQLSAARISKGTTNGDDIETSRTKDGHWDALDALRYGIMSRPRLETLDQRLVKFQQENRWHTVNKYFS